jgi:hypothetical protein
MSCTCHKWCTCGERINSTGPRASSVSFNSFKNQSVKPEPKFNKILEAELTHIGNILEVKNRKYGNSAVSPLNIFSKLSAIAILDSRIDEKISRIKNRQEDEDEDAEFDLLGYLILKRIAKKWNEAAV